MIILSLLCLLGFCTAFSCACRMPIAKTPLYVMSGLINLLYVAAYFSALSVVTSLVYYLGIFSCIYSLYAMHRYALFWKTITPGFCVFVIFTGLLSWIVSFHVFFAWDEFSYWGPLAKLTYLHQGFVTSGDMVHHKEYPPGALLFYYYFYHLSGFSEGSTYVAHLLLILSPLTLVIPKDTWSAWRHSITAFFSIIIILSAAYSDFLTDFSRIYMDMPVAVMLGGLLILYFSSHKKSKDILMLTPIVTAFVLLKPQLFPLVVVLCTVIFTDQFLRDRENTSFKKLYPMGIVLLLGWLMNVSWTHYASAFEITSSWSFMALFHGSVPHYQYFEWTQFIDIAASELPKLALLGLSIVAIGHYRKTPWLNINAILFLGFCAYSAVIFFYYYASVIVYNGYKVNKFLGLSSFNRYSAMYYVAWIMFVYATMLTMTELNRFRNIIVILCSVIVIMMCGYRLTLPYADTAALKQLESAVVSGVPVSQSIFTVWQPEGRLPALSLIYGLTPRAFNEGPYRFGVTKPGFEPFARNSSQETFLQEVGGFDYLFIARGDEAFWLRYGALFGERRPRPWMYYVYEGMPHEAYLFKITHNKGRVNFEGAT